MCDNVILPVLNSVPTLNTARSPPQLTLTPRAILPRQAMGVPLEHPRLDERDLLGLRLAHGQRWQEVRRRVHRLVGEEAVLVPVVDRVGDEDEGLADGGGAVVRGGVEGGRVRGGRAPGVDLPVDEGEARVGDAEAAVLVDRVGVGGLGDVEGLDADYGLPLQGVEARG